MGRKIPKRVKIAKARKNHVDARRAKKGDRVTSVVRPNLREKLGASTEVIMATLAKRYRPFAESAELRFNIAENLYRSDPGLNSAEKKLARELLVGYFANELYNELGIMVLSEYGEARRISDAQAWLNRNLPTYLQRYKFIGGLPSYNVSSRVVKYVNETEGVPSAELKLIVDKAFDIVHPDLWVNKSKSKKPIF